MRTSRFESTYGELKAAAAKDAQMGGDVAAFCHCFAVGPSMMRRILNRLVRDGVMVRDGRADGRDTIYTVKAQPAGLDDTTNSEQEKHV